MAWNTIETLLSGKNSSLTSDAGHREALGKVDGGHGTGDAGDGAAGQQALAPVDGVAAGPDAQRRVVADIPVAEDEGVQQLAALVVQVLGGIVVLPRLDAEHAPAVVVGQAVGQRAALGVIAVFVGRVVPGGTADAETEVLFPDHVQFRQHIDPAADDAPGLAIDRVVRVVLQARGT